MSGSNLASLTKHNMSTEVIDAIIKDAVKTLAEAGLCVDVIVMDQEASQQKWYRSNGATSPTPFVMIENTQLFVVQDPQNLIKV